MIDVDIEIIGEIKNKECNKTHLDVEKALERGIIHRDYLAHCLRWSHAIKYLRRNDCVLDIGCASGILAQTLYVNRYNPDYIGIEIRKNMLEKAKERKLHDSVRWICMDITKNKLPVSNWADVVCCFEVIEHIPKDTLKFVLKNIEESLKENGVCLLSTPNYDGIHKASNHIHEYAEIELELYLTQFFEIINKFGTFASQCDILPKLTDYDSMMFERLKVYYDSTILSIIFAPLYPSQSRNILWVLKKKDKNTKLGDF